MVEMDELLTIKEAATFLHVSEMSLRRWTNSGKLKCFRVGKKKERRFRMVDLQEFLGRKGNEIPLGFKGLNVSKAAHISHFYSDEEECLDLGIAYVKQGLDRGEVVLVVAPEQRRQKLLASLETQGVLVPALENQRILTTFGGAPNLESQGKLVDDLLKKSHKLNGFRLLGDMVWTQSHNWDLEMIYDLEKLTNQQRKGKDALFFCQYDITHFSQDAAFMAMQTHNYTIYHGKLNTSPYYELAKGWSPSI